MGTAYIMPVTDFNPNTTPTQVVNPNTTKFGSSTLCKSRTGQLSNGVVHGIKDHREVTGETHSGKGPLLVITGTGCAEENEIPGKKMKVPKMKNRNESGCWY